MQRAGVVALRFQYGVDVLNVGGVIQKSSNPRMIFDKLQQEISKTGILG